MITRYHRDRSVTLWDVFRQAWARTSAPSDRVLASLSAEERAKVIRHLYSATEKRKE